MLIQGGRATSEDAICFRGAKSQWQATSHQAAQRNAFPHFLQNRVLRSGMRCTSQSLLNFEVRTRNAGQRTECRSSKWQPLPEQSAMHAVGRSAEVFECLCLMDSNKTRQLRSPALFSLPPEFKVRRPTFLSQQMAVIDLWLPASGPAVRPAQRHWRRGGRPVALTGDPKPLKRSYPQIVQVVESLGSKGKCLRQVPSSYRLSSSLWIRIRVFGILLYLLEDLTPYPISTGE